MTDSKYPKVTGRYQSLFPLLAIHRSVAPLTLRSLILGFRTCLSRVKPPDLPKLNNSKLRKELGRDRLLQFGTSVRMHRCTLDATNSAHFLGFCVFFLLLLWCKRRLLRVYVWLRALNLTEMWKSRTNRTLSISSSRVP